MTNKKQRTAAVFQCALVAAALAAALFVSPARAESGIWRWTDAQGKMHYSDQPLGDNAVDMGQRKKFNTAPPAPSSSEKTRVASAAAAASAASPSPAASAVIAFTREETADAKRACDQSNAAVQQLSQGGRISSVDAGGNRTILNDQQIAQQLVQAKAAQTRWCATAPKQQF